MKIAKNLKPAVLSAVIAGAVLFSGCGSEYNEDTKYDVNSMSAAAYDVSEAEYAVDADVNTNVNTKMVQLDAVEETEENEPTMRHYSVSLSIETLDFDKTMSDLSETLNKYQANIINSSEYDSNNNWYVSSMRTPEEGVRNASISARVPSESFESALNDMENISGKVISKNISSVDNTRRYNGNNDRLEALKAEKENMQRLMDETKEAEALVAFYQRLTDINTEIAMYETDNNDIIYDSDFCEFYIDVKTVQNYTEKVAVNASFGEKLSSAFKDGRDGLWKVYRISSLRL